MAKRVKKKQEVYKKSKPLVKKGRSPSNKSRISKVKKLIQLAKLKFKKK